MVLHVLTNDLKSQEPEACSANLIHLVHLVGQKWPEVKCVISLATPRSDDIQYHTKGVIINALIKKKLSGSCNLSFADHSNMLSEGNAMQSLLAEDKFHLSEKGISVLANNIKRAIHNALNISLHHLRNRSISRDRRGQNQQRTPKGRVCGRGLLQKYNQP